MSSRLRLAGTLVALLLPALALGRWFAARDASASAVWAIELPERVGTWKATHEERLDPEVWAEIQPDAHLMRRYEATGRSPIFVYVGLYGGRSGYGKGAHEPEVCYPAAGWEVMSSLSVEIPVDASERLVATRLDLHQGLFEQVALYWFQPAARWTASYVPEQLLLVLDALTGRPQYAFVRLSALPAGAGTVADLAEFASAVAWPVRRALQPRAALEARGSVPGVGGG